MNNTEFAQGLRELAEIYDTHPEMSHLKDDASLFLSLPYATDGDQFRAIVKAMSPIEKLPPMYDGDSSFRIRKTFDSGLVLTVSVDRKAVCRRVRKMVMSDVWECPDSILDPEPA